MGRLDRKVAVVTGGARGIGKQIALTFAREGADVAIGDVLSMESVTQEITALGKQIVTIHADISMKNEVADLFRRTVGTFKRVDILVNNAAVTRHAPVLEITEEDWERVLQVNLKGVLLCTQAAAKEMIERKYGRIINIASTVGSSRVPPKLAAYAASKAGVIQLTRVCARELGPHGITVNAIAPGLVLTDITSIRRDPSEIAALKEDWERNTSLKRVGTTQDIANLALFLASDESAYITGETIACDGGRMG